MKVCGTVSDFEVVAFELFDCVDREAGEQNQWSDRK